MASATKVEPYVFHRPVGNTPPVSLTQTLPPDQDAAVLLLGCGDARSILFTSYMGMGHANRKIDITCCDKEVEILARNITLFTLILDDVHGEKCGQMWNLYNHLLVDDGSLQLLREQSTKLKHMAQNMDEWNKGKYAKLIRFADAYTFSRVKQLWDLYSLGASDGEDFQAQQQRLLRAGSFSRNLQRYFAGGEYLANGIRSAAPCPTYAMMEIHKLYDNFWKTGTTFPEHKWSENNSPKNINPMFGTLDEALALYYGTEPLTGYHLASAYAPLCARRSPLAPNLPDSRTINAAYLTAFGQFKEYAKSFRANAARLTIRFVNSDALAFCHTLQRLAKSGDSKSAGWYRKPRAYTPLILDSGDYTKLGSNIQAPLSFDFIDTSSLVTHLGCLNLFIAAAPLLRPSLTSTLSTQMLVGRKEDLDEYTNNLILGDFPTVGLLFGLVPIQYWTGVGTTSNLSERVAIPILQGDPENKSQARYACLWKSSALGVQRQEALSSNGLDHLMSFDAKELSSLVFQLYLKMFKDEISIRTLSLGEGVSDEHSNNHYTRGSFIALLALIHTSGMVNWEDFMRQLYDQIMSDTTLVMGAHHTQELLIHLHLAGLFQIPYYDAIWSDTVDWNQCFLSTWSSVPPALCITMIVPKRGLSAFDYEFSGPKGTPIAHIMLQRSAISSRGTQSIFSDIQLGIGKLKASGTKFAEDYKLEIENDDRQWNGTAPLIVSVVVPSYMLFLDNDLSTKVIFALKSSPAAIAAFGPKLGMGLEISRSTLSGKDIFITKFRPNMSEHTSFCGKAALGGTETMSTGDSPKSNAEERAQLQFRPSLTSDCSALSSLTTHIEIPEGRYQDMLRSGDTVHVSQDSLFEISVNLGSVALLERLRLPVPVQIAKSKTIIVEDFTYIELTAPIAVQKSVICHAEAHSMTCAENGVVKLSNMYYVTLDQLPILEITDPVKLEWLSSPLRDMFSAKQRKMLIGPSDIPGNEIPTRLVYKQLLQAFFTNFTGVRGGQCCAIIALHNDSQGGVSVLIFPSHLRFDMSSQSAVLDAAMIPLTSKVIPELELVVKGIQHRRTTNVRLKDKLFRLWKYALPGFVERCREWEHTASCEYIKKGKIPLSVEPSEPVICSCGQGKFPKKYRIEEISLWKRVAKHAVRVAIPPCFVVPFVERAWDFSDADPARIPKDACFVCGKEQSETTKLLKCGNCKVVSYCSKICQKIDWKRSHSHTCKLITPQ